MWVPPPHWVIMILLAFAAHIVVVAFIFYARGWVRGGVTIPVGLVVFVVSVIAGVALDAAVWQIDPVPLLVLLSAGIYGTHALMMWRPRRLGGEQSHVS
jgi:hypothetical protein